MIEYRMMLVLCKFFKGYVASSLLFLAVNYKVNCDEFYP